MQLDSRNTCKSQRQKVRRISKQGDYVLRNKANMDRYERFCRLLGNGMEAMQLKMKMSRKMGIDRALRLEQSLGHPIMGMSGLGAFEPGVKIFDQDTT